MKKLNEFDYISKYLKPLTFGNTEARNLVDDCAFFDSIEGLSISTDSSIEGVHVPLGTSIDIQSQRAILRALSDLATFGAKPKCIFATINIPKKKNHLLTEIASAFKEILEKYKIFLAGGDISVYEGPFCFSITVIGEKTQIFPGRSGANVGDLIVMTGKLGDAYLGRLLINNHSIVLDKKNKEKLIKKFYKPFPKIELGRKIAKFATSVIDISDGLLADLNHICINSSVGAKIYIEKLPLSSAVRKMINDKNIKFLDILTGGDDYELLYTIKHENRARLDNDSSVIGQIVEGNVIEVFNENSKIVKFNNKDLGYKHF